MRLHDITEPFLKSNLSVSNFSKSVGLTPARVAAIVKHDLRKVTEILNKKEEYIFIPNVKHTHKKYLNYIYEYYEVCRIGIERQNLSNDVELESILLNMKIIVSQLEILINTKHNDKRN